MKVSAGHCPPGFGVKKTTDTHNRCVTDTPRICPCAEVGGEDAVKLAGVLKNQGLDGAAAAVLEVLEDETKNAASK